jgi:release factor glutamine methyltransferase
MQRYDFTTAIFAAFEPQLSDIYGEEEAKSIIRLAIKHYSGLSRAEILSGKTIDAITEEKIAEALNKALLQVPIQYTLGEAGFYGRQFFVNRDVLIPRSETEELVHMVVSENRSSKINILDIGAGSGCIAVSLACELSAASVYAVDVSQEALKVAAINSNRHKTNVSFARCDILQNTKLPFGVKFDVIVSNPPYVPMSEKKYMSKNVLEHEPHIALFVPDEQPLIYYEACLQIAKNHLQDQGIIYVEINEDLGGDTLDLFQSHDFDALMFRDLSDRDRIIRATKNRPRNYRFFNNNR